MVENSCLTPLQTYPASGHLKYPSQTRCQGQVAHSAPASTRLLKRLSTNVVTDFSRQWDSDKSRKLGRSPGSGRRNMAGSSSRIVQSEPVSAPHRNASTEWKNSIGVSITGSRR